MKFVTRGASRYKYLFLLGFLYSAWSAHVHAQSAAATAYPTNPVRVTVGFAPGGATDIVARMFAQKLSESLGRSFVVENRPGGGGTAATLQVLKSPADGYSILAISGTYTITPAITKSLPYDALRDVAPISLVNQAPFLVVVHPALPVKTVRDLVALAKAQPGKLDYGSAGQGSNVHLSVELLNSMAGIKMTHVPYKGTGQALIDLMAGQVQLTIANILSGLPYARSGRMRGLAVTGPRRVKAAPEIPTVGESGVPGYEVSSWNGWLAHAATPPEIIARLNAELVKASKAPDINERMVGDGGEALGSTPEQFRQYLSDDIVRWRKVVQVAGIRVE